MTKQQTIKLAKYLGAGIAFLFLASVAKANNVIKNTFFYPIVPNQVIRMDSCGSGQFGSGRGDHIHQGIDIKVLPNQGIASPIDGIVVNRDVFPYSTDKNYTGLEIQGTGVYKDYWVKLFYVIPVNGIKGKTVNAGDIIASAQDVTQKYDCADMLPHVHVEVRLYNTELIDPTNLMFENSTFV